MGTIKVQDILVTPLSRICTPGGDVLHALKKDCIGYAGFGEAYFSLIEHGAIKAWKRHLQMTMNLIVPVGTVRFVFIDDLKQRRVIEVGDNFYARITVPNGIWFGFQGLGISTNLLLNLANHIHDPLEVERKGLFEMNFLES